jgi:hypothetical protein
MPTSPGRVEILHEQWEKTTKDGSSHVLPFSIDQFSEAALCERRLMMLNQKGFGGQGVLSMVPCAGTTDFSQLQGLVGGQRLFDFGG